MLFGSWLCVANTITVNTKNLMKKHVDSSFGSQLRKGDLTKNIQCTTRHRESLRSLDIPKKKLNKYWKNYIYKGYKIH